MSKLLKPSLTKAGKTGAKGCHPGCKTMSFRACVQSSTGELAERSNAAVLKTVSPQGLGGSNPSLSARACPASLVNRHPHGSLAPPARHAFRRGHAELVGRGTQNPGFPGPACSNLGP